MGLGVTNPRENVITINIYIDDVKNALWGPPPPWGPGGGRPPRGLGKPQKTLQSPDRLYKAPTDYTKPPKHYTKTKILDKNPKD